MKRLSKEALKRMFCEDVSRFSQCAGTENPFNLTVANQEFHVFIKNISPAYFSNRPDVSRVQLPYSAKFEKILKSSLPFVVIGYDTAKDSYVAWNPIHTKARLNSKANVSLYSRMSFQSSIVSGEFRKFRLKNDELIIGFKGPLLERFFQEYMVLFECNDNKQLQSSDKTYYDSENSILPKEEIMNLIGPLLEKDRVLESVGLLGKHFEGDPRYNSLSFKEWFDVVKLLYASIKS
jgi:hypothetical protein